MEQKMTMGNFLRLPLGERTTHYEGRDLFAQTTMNLQRQAVIQTAPVLYTGLDGKNYPTGQKIGIYNDIPTKQMSMRYTFVANETVHQLVTDAGFKPTKIDFSNDGMKMFVQVFSDGVKASPSEHAWSNDNLGGDIVNVGVMIRNSIDGSASLGGDIFTYRNRCSNGAIIGKKSLGSFYIRHIGEYTKLIQTFKEHVTRAFDLSMKVKPFYRKAQDVLMNLEMAEALVKTQLPKKYLPDFITHTDEGVKLEGSGNVWEAFNQITEKAWHAPVDFNTKAQYTTRANAWLLRTVEPLVVA